MVCDCVYRAMHKIRCRCKEYTQDAQTAYTEGKFAEANALFMEAFEVAHSLLALPLVDNTSVNVLVNSGLNCLQFCQQPKQRLLYLQTMVETLQALFRSAEHESSVRFTALDSCTYFTQLLAEELKSQNNWGEVQEVLNQFEANWSRYAPELIQLN